MELINGPRESRRAPLSEIESESKVKGRFGAKRIYRDFGWADCIVQTFASNTSNPYSTLHINVNNLDFNVMGNNLEWNGFVVYYRINGTWLRINVEMASRYITVRVDEGFFPILHISDYSRKMNSKDRAIYGDDVQEFVDDNRHLFDFEGLFSELVFCGREIIFLSEFLNLKLPIMRFKYFE